MAKIDQKSYLEEKVLNQNGQSLVKHSTVIEAESLQVAKSWECVVSISRGGTALFAKEPDSDVSFLNHRDVIGAVANCKGDWVIGSVSHHSNNFGLLNGRHTATYHTLWLDFQQQHFKQLYLGLFQAF